MQQVPDKEFTLTAWADSNLADGVNQTKSKSGGVILLGHSLIKSTSHRQGSVATSTQQAEVNALVEVVHDIMHLSGLLDEMRIRHDGPITIFEDNQAAIALTIHPSGGRTRYLELYMAAIREQVELGLVEIVYVDTQLNIADFFTKPLVGELFYRFRDAIGLIFV
jgi:hypothetical protein